MNAPATQFEPAVYCDPRLVALLARIDSTHPAEWDTLIAAAVIDYGGHFIPRGSEWGPLETYLDLLGVSGTGDTTEQAIADWTKAVRRTLGTQA